MAMLETLKLPTHLDSTVGSDNWVQKKYKEMFGPNTTYISIPTVYEIKDGMLSLDNTPIRKINIKI